MSCFNLVNNWERISVKSLTISWCTGSVFSRLLDPQMTVNFWIVGKWNYSNKVIFILIIKIILFKICPNLIRIILSDSSQIIRQACAPHPFALPDLISPISIHIPHQHPHITNLVEIPTFPPCAHGPSSPRSSPGQPTCSCLQQKSYRPIHENGGTSTAVLKKKCFKIGILSVSPNPAYHFELSLKFGVGLSPQQGNTNLVLHLE